MLLHGGQVERSKKRLSLGLKPRYFEGDADSSDEGSEGEEGSDEDSEGEEADSSDDDMDAMVAAAAMAPVGIFAPSDDQVLRYVATHVRSRGCTSVPFRTSCLSGRGEPLSLAPWWDSIEK